MHAGLAEMQLALHPVTLARQDCAALKPGQEHGGLFHPIHQAVPDLFHAQGLDERIEGVVDLDEMFEMQGLLPKSALQSSLS